MDRIVFDRLPEEASYRSQSPNEGLSGNIEASYLYSALGGAGADLHANTWALRGSVNGETHTLWNLQLDIGYGQTYALETSVDRLVGAAHIYYRQPEQYAIGAFIQGNRYAGEAFNLAPAFGLDSYAANFVGGGEAAIFVDNATVFGRLGYGRILYSGVGVDHVLAGAGVRLYATDNLRFDLEGGLNRISYAGANGTVYSLSGVGNYRVPDTPVTAYAGYRFDHGRVDYLDAEVGDGNAHSVLAGLRFNFGTQTLKQEERNGPAWTAPPTAF